MYKKIITIFLAVSLIMSLSSACAKKEDTTGGTTSNTAASTTKAAAATTQEQTTTAVAEPIKVYYLDPATGKRNPSNEETMAELKAWIIEQTGISPEPYIVPPDLYEQKLSLMLSSGADKLDMFIHNWDKFASKGALTPVNDLIENYGQDILAISKPDSLSAMTDGKGNMWGIAQPKYMPVKNFVLVRADWLDKLLMKKPKNMDELEIVLKAFKDNDPSGTGSTIPLISENTDGSYTQNAGSVYNELSATFMGEFKEGGVGNWIDSDGTVKPYYLHEGFKNFITKMNDWYKKGYIYKESFISNKAQLTELVKQNKVGVIAQSFYLINQIYPDLKQAIPELNYEVCEDMTSEYGGLQTYSPASTFGLLFPAKAENPEAMMKYINWQYTEEGKKRTESMYGPEGVNWEIKGKSVHKASLYDIKVLGDTKLFGDFRFMAAYGDAMNFAVSNPAYEFTFYCQDFGYDPPEGMAQRAFDMFIRYELSDIQQSVPQLSDIQRMVKEEPIKFIIGQRPMSEFDDFINRLYSAGVDKLIAELTRQYNALKE